IRLETGFALYILLRRDEELIDIDHAFTLRIDQLQTRSQCRERDRSRRRMHNTARPVAEYRMETIISSLRQAGCTALLQAIETFSAIVPATGRLREVAANGGHVADLRRGGACGGVGKRREAGSYSLVGGYSRKSRKRAYAQRAVRFELDVVEIGNR